MNVEGSKIVVIGSGATAITLIPALEKAGADVTMLQRSPSYVAPLPEIDIISSIWKKLLPAGPAYRAARFNHAARDMAQFVVAQRTPWLFKNALRLMQRPYLSKDQIDEHFTPRYNPWDQRVCKAPNGDIFSALKRNAHVVTDTIERFTADGIRLASGKELDADIIVTATGLEIEVFGGGSLSIDGKPLDNHQQVFYRGIMLAGLPNFSFTVGYVNASWTLRSDMVSRYMVKLWKTGEEFYSPALPPVVTTVRYSTSPPGTFSAVNTACPPRATVRPGSTRRTTSRNCQNSPTVTSVATWSSATGAWHWRAVHARGRRSRPSMPTARSLKRTPGRSHPRRPSPWTVVRCGCAAVGRQPDRTDRRAGTPSS